MGQTQGIGPLEGECPIKIPCTCTILRDHTNPMGCGHVGTEGSIYICQSNSYNIDTFERVLNDSFLLL